MSNHGRPNVLSWLHRALQHRVAALDRVLLGNTWARKDHNSNMVSLAFSIAL